MTLVGLWLFVAIFGLAFLTFAVELIEIPEWLEGIVILIAIAPTILGAGALCIILSLALYGAQS